MSIKRWMSAVGLVAVGAVGTYGVSHLDISFRPTAAADPAVTDKLPPPTPSQVADARALGRTFSQVAAQVGPSVVRISVTKKAHGGMHGMRGRTFRFGPGGPGGPGGPDIDKFFREFGGGPGGPGNNDDGEGEGPVQQGTGSGVVIDAKGHILTNNHVVDGADEVKVTFVDGKTIKGKVVGTDPKTDLAVVKVDGVPVKPAKLGDSDKALVGDWVIAIGNPFGLDHTVTVGVLSAKNRSGFQADHYEDFLQTDASINPGNSGGPLVDLDGEVIGINTMIAGLNTGIGFAVPSSMAKPIVAELIDHGKVKRAYLGIRMQDVSDDIQKSLGAKAPEKGAIVSNVEPGSPADRAGVKSGDVITAVDGAAVSGSRALQMAVIAKRVGQKVDLAVWRDGKELHLPATTAELPSDRALASGGGGDGRGRGGDATHEKTGIELQTLTPELAARLGVERSAKGVVITSIKDGSPAAQTGLQEGDVIVEVDRKAVATADEAAHGLSARRQGGHLLRIVRGDATLFVAIPAE
jgi:serine protease Do